MTRVATSGDGDTADFLRLVMRSDEEYVVLDNTNTQIAAVYIDNEDLARAVFTSVVDNWQHTQRRTNLVEGAKTKRGHIISIGKWHAKFAKDQKMMDLFDKLSYEIPLSEQCDVGDIRAFFAREQVHTSVDPD